MAIQAASRAYFDKDVNELTLPEAAYLAVLPKAPSNYDPVRATQKALDSPQLRAARDGEQRVHHRRAACGRRGDPARHDPLRQQREIPRSRAAISWKKSAATLLKSLRREGRGRAEQPLCRRAVGAHLDEPGHAGRGRRGACAKAWRKFDGGRGWRDLEKSVDLDGDWAGELDRTPRRHRLSRLAEGRRPVEGFGQAHDRLHQRLDRDAAAFGGAKCPSAAAAAPRSAISGRA